MTAAIASSSSAKPSSTRPSRHSACPLSWTLIQVRSRSPDREASSLARSYAAMAASKSDWNHATSPCIHAIQPWTGESGNSSARRWARAAHPWACDMAWRIPCCSATRNAAIAAAARSPSSTYAPWARSRTSSVSSGWAVQYAAEARSDRPSPLRDPSRSARVRVSYASSHAWRARASRPLATRSSRLATSGWYAAASRSRTRSRCRRCGAAGWSLVIGTLTLDPR